MFNQHTYWFIFADLSISRVSRTTPKMSLQPYETTDKIISAVLILLLAISVFGNITAFFYFWTNRRKSLPNKLYMTIIIVDLITSFSSVPVITSLLNSRKPMIFASPGLCTTYLLSVNFSMRMAMFLVAVLSITRSVSIVTPHRTRNIKSKLIAVSIICYGALLLGVDGLFLAKRWFISAYNQHMPACVLDMPKEKPPSMKTIMTHFGLTLTEILTPPVLVFISLIITIVALKKSVPRSNRNTESRLRQISITVALFTAQHLVCTLPLFIYVLCQALLFFARIAELSWFFSGHMIWYGQITFIVLPSCLNTALNPCLYFWRMPRLRKNIWMSLSSVRRGAHQARDTEVQSLQTLVPNREASLNRD